MTNDQARMTNDLTSPTRQREKRYARAAQAPRVLVRREVLFIVRRASSLSPRHCFASWRLRVPSSELPIWPERTCHAKPRRREGRQGGCLRSKRYSGSRFASCAIIVVRSAKQLRV